MRSIDKVLREMGLGSTEPILCEIDGGKYVAKWQKCAEEHYPLINEFIGYEICKGLQVKLPSHEFVTMSSAGVQTNETDFDYAQSDIFFACEFISNLTPLTSGAQLKTVKHSDILRMIFIDILLCNKDRNKGNMLLYKRKSTPNLIIYPIDYSHAFYLGCVWAFGQFKHILNDTSCLNDLTQYLDQQGYHIIFSTLTFSQEQILEVGNEIKELLKLINLEEIFSRIPKELSSLCDSKDLNYFMEFLLKRFSEIDQITMELIRYLHVPKLKNE